MQKYPKNSRELARIMLLFALVPLGMQLAGGGDFPDLFGTGPAAVRAADGQTDIQWFREQMKISDKYLEQEEGVLGMSWTHFLTMVILSVFAAGTFAAFILRYKRTRQILEEIRKEK